MRSLKIGIVILVLTGCGKGFKAEDVSSQSISEDSSIHCLPKAQQNCFVGNGFGVQTCAGSGSWGLCGGITSCTSGYHLQDGGCAANLCTPNAQQSCAVDNGTGSQTCNSLGTAWDTCANPTNCNSGYNLQNGVCVANICVSGTQKSCQSGSDIGSQTCNPSGSAWGACGAFTSCGAGEYLLNGVCLISQCAPNSQETCKAGNGTGTRTCEMGTWRSCGNLTSCDTGYDLQNGACVINQIFVAPNGNDSNPGTTASPIATIQHARDLVRTLNTAMQSDITVEIRQGTYSLNSPIAMSELDSGHNGFRVIYQSVDGPGAAKILAGYAITSWTQFSGNIYRATVPVGTVFHDLYENGVRAVIARTPNINAGWGISTTSQGPWLKNMSYIDSSTTQFKYVAGDFNPTGLNLANLQVSIFPGGYYNWENETHPVAAIDPANQIVTLTGGTGYDLGPGSRYFVENDLSLLDAPGEFFLDSNGGYVYYYSRVGSINSQTIIAPSMASIFILNGASGTSPISDVVFDGLDLEATDFSASESGAMFLMSNTQRISIRNSHLKNIGTNGIEMNGYNKSNTVYGNYIENIGVSGIIMTGDTSYAAGAVDENRDHTIRNNRIEFIGLHSATSGGIRFANAGHSEVSNNAIKYGSRWLIEGGSTVDILPQYNFFAGNHFAYNILTNSTQDSADAGAFYTWGAVFQGQNNVIEQTIVDMTGWDPNSNLHLAPGNATAFDTTLYNEPTFGVYFDDESSWWTAQNIVVTNAPVSYITNGSSETLSNVSWQAGFDNTQIDYANIGLLPDFPAGYR